MESGTVCVLVCVCVFYPCVLRHLGTVAWEPRGKRFRLLWELYPLITICLIYIEYFNVVKNLLTLLLQQTLYSELYLALISHTGAECSPAPNN